MPPPKTSVGCAGALSVVSFKPLHPTDERIEVSDGPEMVERVLEQVPPEWLANGWTEALQRFRPRAETLQSAVVAASSSLGENGLQAELPALLDEMLPLFALRFEVSGGSQVAPFRRLWQLSVWFDARPHRFERLNAWLAMAERIAAEWGEIARTKQQLQRLTSHLEAQSIRVLDAEKAVAQSLEDAKLRAKVHTARTDAEKTREKIDEKAALLQTKLDHLRRGLASRPVSLETHPAILELQAAYAEAARTTRTIEFTTRQVEAEERAKAEAAVQLRQARLRADQRRRILGRGVAVIGLFGVTALVWLTPRSDPPPPTPLAATPSIDSGRVRAIFRRYPALFYALSEQEREAFERRSGEELLELERLAIQRLRKTALLNNLIASTVMKLSQSAPVFSELATQQDGSVRVQLDPRADAILRQTFGEGAQCGLSTKAGDLQLATHVRLARGKFCEMEAQIFLIVAVRIPGETLHGSVSLATGLPALCGEKPAVFVPVPGDFERPN